MELLVKKAKRGDAEAFIALIEQNKPGMYRVARGFLRDEEDAADAMAQTVLDCFEKLPSLKNDGYFKTWMIRILINNCKDILRRRTYDVPLEEAPQTGNAAHEEGVFRELIEPLGERDQSIFTLYYAYGLKIREIADYMGMNTNTVTSRLKRGRETLKKEMQS